MTSHSGIRMTASLLANLELKDGWCPHISGISTSPSFVTVSLISSAGSPRWRVSVFSSRNGVRMQRTQSFTLTQSTPSSMI